MLGSGTVWTGERLVRWGILCFATSLLGGRSSRDDGGGFIRSLRLCGLGFGLRNVSTVHYYVYLAHLPFLHTRSSVQRSAFAWARSPITPSRSNDVLSSSSRIIAGIKSHRRKFWLTFVVIEKLSSRLLPAVETRYRLGSRPVIILELV